MNGIRLAGLATGLVWMVFAAPAQAGVNLKNGNYYISYTDVSVGGDELLEVKRTYNSKSAGDSMFGEGWGNDFDTYLGVHGDGSVTIRENGSGARTHFEPPRQTREELETAVRLILDASEREGRLRPGEREVERRELLRERVKRNRAWSRYARRGLLPRRRLAPGTVLRSKQRGNQIVLRTATGYRRMRSNGESDEFDAEGNLVRIRERHGWLDLTRDSEGRLLRVEDHRGRALDFVVDDDGHVDQILREGKVVARYHFDGNRLVWSRDASDNEYTYQYDPYDNLVAIRYQDGSQRRMSYDGAGMIRSLTTRKGATTWYRYADLYDREDRKAYFTEVIKPGRGGRSVTARYEYHSAVLPNGGWYQRRIRTVVNGVETDKVYDPDGRPLRIRRGSRETKFRYDDQGRLLFKDDGRMVIEMKYAPVGKISEVRRRRSGSSESAGTWTRFDYDALGNLTRAWSRAGEEVRLEYADGGRIERMHSGDDQLEFEYNEDGKPVVIRHPELGETRVKYDTRGEIEKVESDEGHKMAMRITQLFQRMLSLVKPAGVDLNL